MRTGGECVHRQMLSEGQMESSRTTAANTKKLQVATAACQHYRPAIGVSKWFPGAVNVINCFVDGHSFKEGSTEERYEVESTNSRWVRKGYSEHMVVLLASLLDALHPHSWPRYSICSDNSCCSRLLRSRCWEKHSNEHFAIYHHHHHDYCYRVVSYFQLYTYIYISIYI